MLCFSRDFYCFSDCGAADDRQNVADGFSTLRRPHSHDVKSLAHGWPHVRLYSAQSDNIHVPECGMNPRRELGVFDVDQSLAGIFRADQHFFAGLAEVTKFIFSLSTKNQLFKDFIIFLDPRVRYLELFRSVQNILDFENEPGVRKIFRIFLASFFFQHFVYVWIKICKNVVKATESFEFFLLKFQFFFPFMGKVKFYLDPHKSLARGRPKGRWGRKPLPRTSNKAPPTFSHPDRSPNSWSKFCSLWKCNPSLNRCNSRSILPRCCEERKTVSRHSGENSAEIMKLTESPFLKNHLYAARAVSRRFRP